MLSSEFFILSLCIFVCLCCRFLATGDSYRCIADSYRVGISTVAGIVNETVTVIWDKLAGQFMAVPTAAEWTDISAKFQEKWDFPLCCGAVDGKHVVMKAPPNSGSRFNNYKGTFSIVLLAVVDADLCFRVIDVGGYGRTSDGGILANSRFGQALHAGTLPLPPDRSLPGAEWRGPQPHVFVADEAFPLQRHLMRPFPGQRGGPLPIDKQTFNYRLSRARMVVECAFGVLSSQWRLYRRQLEVGPEVAEKLVKATCVLHNFLRRNKTSHAASAAREDHTCDGVSTLPRVQNVGSRNPTREAIQVRETYCSYFMAEGAVMR